MFGDNAVALVRELHQVIDPVPRYAGLLVEEVIQEIKELTYDNRKLVQIQEQENSEQYVSTVRVQHAAVQRNLRCLIAYHHTRLRRLRSMRWEFGSVLPPEIRSKLNYKEFQWFKDYNRILANYMRCIGGTKDGGLNLCMNLKPPKLLYVEVKCLSEYGYYELSDGTPLNLKKNARYFLPKGDCEELIRQGVFEHILM